MDKALEILNELNTDGQGKNPEWERDYLSGHKKRYIETFELVEEYHEGGKILDVGAAPGHFTYLLEQKGYSTIGVDLNPERISEEISSAVDLRECNIETEEMPIESGEISTVVFTEVLEHLRINPIFTINEIHRVLDENGVMLLSTPNVYGIFSLVQFLLFRDGINGMPYDEFKKIEELGHMGHVREYSRSELEHFLTNCGFDIEEFIYTMFDTPPTGSTPIRSAIITALMSITKVIAPLRETVIVIARKNRND